MDASEIAAARHRLGRSDPALRRADAATPPYVWRRQDPGFEGLFRIILGQQISTKAAAAIFERCRAGLVAIRPEIILSASRETLRDLGLGPRKVEHLHAVARALIDGALDLDALKTEPDEVAIGRLTTLPGIGRWTAEIYLMFSEGRRDLCPEGDLALREALRLAEGGTTPIAPRDFSVRARDWSPDRSHAAHLLWAYYAVRKAALKSKGQIGDRLGAVAKISQ